MIRPLIYFAVILVVSCEVCKESSLIGHDFSSMSSALNDRLEEKHGASRPCSDFTIEELNDMMALLLNARPNNSSQEYDDGRALRFDTLEEYKAFWAEESMMLKTEKEGNDRFDLEEITRDGKCHEAVMIFIHHLPKTTREELAQSGIFTWGSLPQIPREHHFDKIPQMTSEVGSSVADSYTRAVSCADGHITTPTDEKYSPSCYGVDDESECPVWPEQFSAPFGLYATAPPIKNASSMFYYKVTETFQKQLIDYLEKCLPLAPGNALHNEPCKLYFQAEGIFLSQPAKGVNCCLFVEQVSAVPIQFLHSFTRKGQNVYAPDLYGNKVLCDYWEGPGGFAYWTVGNDDPLYHNFGHDIKFQDGQTGVSWRWGNFNVSSQDESIFDLPGSMDECMTPCS